MSLITPTLQKNTGMKGGFCPVTHVRAPNVSRSFDDFAISYNPQSAGYGCDTTALVLRGRVFFVLNGDHSQTFCDAAVSLGIQGCVDYFIDNIDQANRLSEHYMATGLKDDPFSLQPTAVDVIGALNVSRITKACA